MLPSFRRNIQILAYLSIKAENPVLNAHTYPSLQSYPALGHSYCGGYCSCKKYSGQKYCNEYIFIHESLFSFYFLDHLGKILPRRLQKIKLILLHSAQTGIYMVSVISFRWVHRPVYERLHSLKTQSPERPNASIMPYVLAVLCNFFQP